MAYTIFTDFDPALTSFPSFVDPDPYDMGEYALGVSYDEIALLTARENSFAPIFEEDILSGPPNFLSLALLPFKRPIKGYYAWAGQGATARPVSGYLYPRKSTV